MFEAAKEKKLDISKLCINNNEITDKVDIFNILNTYFCNIGKNLVHKHQASGSGKDDTKFQDYLKLSQLNSMVCDEIDDAIISGLDCSKSV